MKGGIGDLMKQAQQMQADMQKAQEEIANMQIEGQSGAGLVKVVMNGQHELLRVTIEDSLTEDKEMLEDLIAAAVNDATHKLAEESKGKMSGLTAGLDLPPGIKMPF